jgi:L-ascorbate 6-phosphate lactonase
MVSDDNGAGDGRGIIRGSYPNEDRPMTRERWLAEVFPEWGTFLNKQLEEDVVEPGTFALWWLSGPSWAMKTSAGGVFLIDCYSGPSLYTDYSYCGVCRIGGAPSINWLRLSPMVHDPWAFKTLHASFMTHLHQDHCDIYTIKATMQTTHCTYVGPRSTIDKTRRFGVPEDRITQVQPGDVLEMPGATVRCLINYDEIARRTGVPVGQPRSYGEAAISYLFETDGGNVLFLGDTIYHNGYKAIGDQYKIDVAIFDMGHNAPGATDKMTPWDCFRVGQALNARVIIPDHYDNWANTQIDPAQLERIVKDNQPEMKTVIMQAGGKFVYPRDENIGRYKYPDYRELYRAEDSWEYGQPARDSGLL